MLEYAGLFWETFGCGGYIMVTFLVAVGEGIPPIELRAQDGGPCRRGERVMTRFSQVPKLPISSWNYRGDGVGESVGFYQILWSISGKVPHLSPTPFWGEGRKAAAEFDVNIPVSLRLSQNQYF